MVQVKKLLLLILLMLSGCASSGSYRSELDWNERWVYAYIGLTELDVEQKREPYCSSMIPASLGLKYSDIFHVPTSLVHKVFMPTSLETDLKKTTFRFCAASDNVELVHKNIEKCALLTFSKYPGAMVRILTTKDEQKIEDFKKRKYTGWQIIQTETPSVKEILWQPDYSTCTTMIEVIEKR